MPVAFEIPSTHPSTQPAIGGWLRGCVGGGGDVLQVSVIVVTDYVTEQRAEEYSDQRCEFGTSISTYTSPLPNPLSWHPIQLPLMLPEI